MNTVATNTEAYFNIILKENVAVCELFKIELVSNSDKLFLRKKHLSI